MKVSFVAFFINLIMVDLPTIKSSKFPVFGAQKYYFLPTESKSSTNLQPLPIFFVSLNRFLVNVLEMHL